MILTIISFMVGFLFSLAASSAIPNNQLRAINAPVCNADNCLRALQNSAIAPLASPFCSSYIPAATTVNLTTTTTFTESLNNLATQPITTITITLLPTTTQTPITSIPTLPTTTQTQTPITSIPTIAPRAISTTSPTTSTSLPTYLSNCDYAPTRISSACSCLVTPTITHIFISEIITEVEGTITLPTETVTITSLKSTITIQETTTMNPCAMSSVAAMELKTELVT